MEIEKETIQRIQKSIGDGMSDILTEYAIWMRMREVCFFINFNFLFL